MTSSSETNPNNDKVVIFNGPPRSGKTTLIGKLLDKYEPAMAELHFADMLKVGVHQLLSLRRKGISAYERCKDVRHEDFFGEVPREVYIKASELFMKPTFGDDIFGRVWLREYFNSFGGPEQPRPVVLSVCGFAEELLPLEQFFGTENITLLRLHREGCNFKNDSRGYIEGYNILGGDYDVYNAEDDIAKAEAQIHEILEAEGVLASI